MMEFILSAAPRWALNHAPALLIMVPLFLAPVLTLVPSGRIAWLTSVGATIA